MKVRGADFIVYYVTDLHRAVAFYRDILKLPMSIFKEDWNWAEFTVEPTTLVLFGYYPAAPLKAGERGAAGIIVVRRAQVDVMQRLEGQSFQYANPFELEVLLF